MLDNYLEQNTKHSSTQDKKRYIQPENNGLESSCEKINKKCGDVPKNMMKKKSRKNPENSLTQEEDVELYENDSFPKVHGMTYPLTLPSKEVRTYIKLFSTR